MADVTPPGSEAPGASLDIADAPAPPGRGGRRRSWLGGWIAGIAASRRMVGLYRQQWEESNRRDAAGDEPLWVVLGDSTAQGIGAPSFDAGYVGQVRRLLESATGTRWRVLNLSRSGAKSFDVVRGQLPRLSALTVTPDLITCVAGANDMLRIPPETTAANLRTIMHALPPGSIIATVPDGLRPQRSAMANRVIREEAPRAGLIIADLFAHTGPPWTGRFSADGFHPNARGYESWTAALAEVIPQLR